MRFVNGVCVKSVVGNYYLVTTEHGWGMFKRRITWKVSGDYITEDSTGMLPWSTKVANFVYACVMDYRMWSLGKGSE